MIMNIKRGWWLREKTIATKMVVNNNQQGVQTLQPMRSTKTIRMVKAGTWPTKGGKAWIRAKGILTLFTKVGLDSYALLGIHILILKAHQFPNPGISTIWSIGSLISMVLFFSIIVNSKSWALFFCFNYYYFSILLGCSLAFSNLKIWNSNWTILINKVQVHC